MEADILEELLNWSSARIGQKEAMKKRFGRLLELFRHKINFEIIKVAGTNGKGSTAAMLSSCLHQEGKKVGLFTSPHLISITERFRINEENVDLNAIVASAESLRSPLYDFVEEHGSRYTPSFFEILILIGIELFNRAGVEIAIFEAGVGGENDSTSLLHGKLSLLTSIGLDHAQKLGNTLEAVASDKAGIANPGTTLIVNGAIQDSLKTIIRDRSSAYDVEMIVSKDYIDNFETTLSGTQARAIIEGKNLSLQPSLRGDFQRQNLNLLIEAWLFLWRDGTVRTINALRGVNKTIWFARFERIGSRPTWLLDSAHNPHALRALADALDQVSEKADRVLLFGNSEEKDYRTMLKIVPKISSKIYLVDDFYRAISRRTFLTCLDEKYVFNKNNSSIEEVISMIIEKHRDELIVVAGSIFMVGLVRKQLLTG